MADYFVTPAESEPWSFDPTDLAAALRERWPDARVAEVPGGHPGVVGLEWWTERDGRFLAGAVSRDGRTVRLSGDVADAAELAVWLRSTQPPERRIVFWDEDGEPVLPIEAATTPAELAAPFLG
jgi:hypothetical protein